jgi:hypothetical protein
MFRRMEKTLEVMYLKWRGLLWRPQGRIASKVGGKICYLKCSGIYRTSLVWYHLKVRISKLELSMQTEARMVKDQWQRRNWKLSRPRRGKEVICVTFLYRPYRSKQVSPNACC